MSHGVLCAAENAACVERLRAALRDPLPGLPVQLGMAPVPRPGTERILDPQLDCRRAGVLVLLYPVNGEQYSDISAGSQDCDLGLPAGMAEVGGWPGLNLQTVLTRRTEVMGNHGGQISFPGGSIDAGEDAAAAALREAYEELGILPDALTLVGWLSPLYISHSGFCVYPVVAHTANRPDFVPNANEVAEVLEVPLTHLAQAGARCEEMWPIRGIEVRVPFYAVGPHKVWGATAMILCELLASLRRGSL